MKSLLLAALLQIVARLTAPALVERMKEVVAEVALRQGLTGAERRELALDLIRMVGDEASAVARDTAGHMLNLALEAVVAWARHRAQAV
jgi:hypothetical protein